MTALYLYKNIRSTFTNYFQKNDHELIASSSLVPHNDPSLMFVNSGMVQFKNIFTGALKSDKKRAVTVQKCVRAGGKHNDLDNVGYTARHHTFFEMMGNFSFGDYFKEKAITHAWNLITNEYKLPKDKLYVTYYHTDIETALIWKKVTGFDDSRIIKISNNDNFWSMGELGPCGPSTEIFYDYGDSVSGGLPGTPSQDGDRYVEIWNLVFMQYEQISADQRIELPSKSVDTGMGLERLASVLSGKTNNYDTEIFSGLIDNIAEHVNAKITNENIASMRIIADHLRSASFLMADGIMPSNEGRGYVLRRIMRRAMRHAHNLGATEPLMYKIVPALTNQFGAFYEELKSQENLISQMLKNEEEKFKQTLDKGLNLLEQEAENLSKNSMLNGEIAFKLYDTYGFPLDLTEDILKNRQIQVDIDGFNAKMNEQKERARKAWNIRGDGGVDKLWFDVFSKHGATEFVGYSHEKSSALLHKIFAPGQASDQASGQSDANEAGALEEKSNIDMTNKGEFYLIFNQTPCYGESGGQMGDRGIITNKNCKIEIIDTLKFIGKIHAHKCKLISGNVLTGESYDIEIDSKYRANLKRHHSATHLLHAALRAKYGEFITQKGSLVDAEKLRFDFSCVNAPQTEELIEIEREINDVILANNEVTTSLMNIDDAKRAGALALFGEKYEDEVRVVSMGNSPANQAFEYKDSNNKFYSTELCGGTHVKRTGDIGAFKITSHSAIAAGIRRIEAVAGTSALKYFNQQELMLDEICKFLKAPKNEALIKLEQIFASAKTTKKQVENLQTSLLNQSLTNIEQNAINTKFGKIYYNIFDDIDVKLIRTLANKHAKADLAVILGSKLDDKCIFVIATDKNSAREFNAANIAKEFSMATDGSGGGKDDLAQIGVSNISLDFKQILKNL